MIRKRRREHLTRGLALFRGAPLEDLAYAPFAQAEVGRLDDLRATALEQRIDADLALGRHADLIGELESLVADYPLREHAWGQLMLAEYRSGRQGEALATFDHARHKLADELGIDPGQSLQQLHQQILRQDPALQLPPTADEAKQVAPASRRDSIPRRGARAGRRRTRLLLAAAGVVAAAGDRGRADLHARKQPDPHRGIADNRELGRGDRLAQRAPRRRREHRRQRRRTGVRIRRDVGTRRTEAYGGSTSRLARSRTSPWPATTSPSARARRGCRSGTKIVRIDPTLPHAEHDPPPDRRLPCRLGRHEHRRRPGGGGRIAVGRPGRPVRAQDRSRQRQGHQVLHRARRRAPHRGRRRRGVRER